jgi:hypothetical protein
MKKKPRKTKLPTWLEKTVRAPVPASLPPEFINEIIAGVVRAHGKITAETEEEGVREVKREQENLDKHVRQMMALKCEALLFHYGIPEDAPDAGWHSAAAGWRLAWALAYDFVPGFAPTDTPVKPVGAPSKTPDEKLVMAVEAALAKPGTSLPQAFARVARLPEYKKRSPRKGGPGWVKSAYYRAKREMSRPSLAKLYQEGQ